MKKLSRNRVRTKPRLQYESTECGAASLGIILGYFGLYIELSELRKACGVSRDGSNARRLLNAGRGYGLEARFYSCTSEDLIKDGLYPCIAFWGFNHFLVIEGFDKKYAYLSDPARGRLRVDIEEFKDQFTGIILEFKPGKNFIRGGHEKSQLSVILPLLWPYRGSLLTLILLSSGQAAIVMFTAGLTTTFIDSFMQNGLLYFGIPIIWLLLLSVVSWLAVLSMQFVVLRRLEVSLSKRITADLFKKAFCLEFDFFQLRLQGELASRMLLGMQSSHVLIAQIIRFGTNLWVSILILLIALLISRVLSSVVLGLLLINLTISWILTKLRSDSNIKLSIEKGKAQGKGLQALNNLETIKASGLEFDFLSRWQSSFGIVIEQNQILGSQIAAATIAANGTSLLLNGLIVTIGGLLIIAGKLSLGSLVAFQFIQNQLSAPLNQLPQLNATVQNLVGDFGRIEDLKKGKEDPLVTSLAKPDQPLEFKKRDIKGSIEIKKLDFSYNNESPFLLKNIELKITAGSLVSIVGSSGSGKTTLMRLIAGLYRPTRGQILYDGYNWTEDEDSRIRSFIAYVPQQVFIFNASIKDNITLWNPSFSESEIEQATIDAHIDKLIRSHPETYERHLRDNGSDLSGGERQRIELSRALLRKPRILLLDEATSALDNKIQQSIFARLKTRKITIVNIAHRLDTALSSDQIIVIKDGEMIEKGNPFELMNTDSEFKRLVSSEEQDRLIS